jgi:hypothetical protein
MIELVSGMPQPQFGDESSLSARIIAGSRFLSFVLIEVRFVGVPQIEDHCLTQLSSI